MAFFRKWKLNTKHKKLSEDWGLATSLKDLAPETPDADIEEDQNLITTFNLKYLGSTPIDSEKSKNATADAIKTVMSTPKSARSKSQRVNLNVSPSGIEMQEAGTGNTLLRVSIYKISYCSADAAHDHVFAFIGSPSDVVPAANADAKKVDTATISKAKDEQLACYVFLCAKRRIAHDVTLTVARCFENAYQTWRHTVERKMYTDELRNRSKAEEKKTEVEDLKKEESIRDLLIDFTPEIRSDLFEKDHREYLQNTWVAFDDEPKDVDRFCTQPWEQQLVC